MSETNSNRRINTREAEAYTGVPVKLIRAAVRRGDLPCLAPNPRVYLFTKEDLDEWLDSIQKGA